MGIIERKACQISRWVQLKNIKSGYLFVFVPLSIFAIFILYPIGGTLFVSLYKWSGLGSMKYVNSLNYLKLIYDSSFLNAMKNTLIWIFLSSFLSVSFGLLIAVLLENVGRHWAIVFKMVIFAPMSISAVASGIIWTLMYNPDFGVVNSFLKGIGLKAWARPWLGDPHTVLYAIIIAYVWVWTGFCMIVLSAGLKGISTELIDAAKVDGANSWQLFYWVTLPLLKSTLGVVVILTAISSLKVFDIIYTMTGGGPFRSSEVAAYSMYTETFLHAKMGYGAAIAVILFIMVLLPGIPLVRRLVRQ